MKRPAPILIALAVVAITAAATLLVRHVPWLTAKVSDDRGAVWLLRPVLAPGDDVEIEVATFGGRRAGIVSIDVSGPGTSFSVKGRGNDWGALLQTRASSRGEAFEVVTFRLPDSAVVGQDMVFDVGVHGVYAESLGGSAFHNTGAESHYAIHVRPVAPATRTMIRVGAAIVAALWLFVATLALARTRAAEAEQERELGHARYFGGLALFGAAAWLVFGTAMHLATGIYGDYVTVAFVVGGFGLPWLGASRLRGAPPPDALTGRMVALVTATGYRAPGLFRATDTAAKVTRALARIPKATTASTADRIRVEARAAFHRPASSFVELSLSAEEGELARLRFNDSELLLTVSVAVAREIGAFTLEVERGRAYQYVIDEHTDAAAVVRAFRRAQREEIAQGEQTALADARAELLGVLAARTRRTGGKPY